MAAFVGRGEELVAVCGVADAASRGAVAAAVVVGDSGRGKSRLLAEVAGRVGLSAQFRVVGYEPGRQVPFGAAAELVRALADAGPAGARLAELVFEASGPVPVRVFEAAHRALRAVGPALLVVDDLQWVDELSLALFNYLVRAARGAGQPFALIAAARPSPSASSLLASLGQLLPPDRLRSVELGPLPDVDALALLRALAPTIGEERERVLVKRAAGSPFWLEALVRGEGAEADAGRLVTGRLRGASADAGGLLALLAVAGRPLAIADAAELAGWSGDRAEHAARELVVSGVAVETAGTVRMAHDLVRAAAIDEIPAERRLELHRRIGEWLSRVAGSDVRRLREALFHRHAAKVRCVELADRLVRSPQRTLLGEDGLELLVGIAEQEEPFDPAALALMAEVAGLASALARHDVALRLQVGLAERLRDSLGRAHALLGAARSAFAFGELDRARAYLAHARAAAPGDQLGLQLDTQEAVFDLWSDGTKQRGRTLAHEVAARARRLFDLQEISRDTYLDALRVEYDACFQEDDVDGMVRAASERADVARGFDEEAHLTALIASARALRRTGRLEEALERVRYVWGEAQRRVLPRLTLDAGYWLGTLLLVRGLVAAAQSVVREAAELAVRVGDEPRDRHALERLASEVEYQEGDWRAGVQRLLAHARAQSEHARIGLLGDAAAWLALAGGPELAREVLAHLEMARTCAERASCPRCATELRLTSADALAHIAEHKQAARSLAEWRRMQPKPQPRELLLCRRVEALGAGEGSIALLQLALDDVEQLGFALDGLWTRIDLASVLRATDRTRSKDMLADVAERASECGAVTCRQVAERRLRALGVRTWRRGAGTEPLTDRERAVARLIAAGASNPEIAQRLFLSRKTVERHVTNILQKVGARNRVELAARVAELELEGVHR